VHPHILCKHKLLFWMRLITINRLKALTYIHFSYIFKLKKCFKNYSVAVQSKKWICMESICEFPLSPEKSLVDSFPFFLTVYDVSPCIGVVCQESDSAWVRAKLLSRDRVWWWTEDSQRIKKTGSTLSPQRTGKDDWQSRGISLNPPFWDFQMVLICKDEYLKAIHSLLKTCRLPFVCLCSPFPSLLIP